MASFRDSKFRNLSLKLVGREEYYEQLKVSNAANDNNMIATSANFLSYIDGGAAVAVLPLSSVGKNHIPVLAPTYQQPLIRHHTQQVRDIAFNPFNGSQLYTASLDCSLKMWDIPKGGYIVDPSEAQASVTSDTVLHEIAAHPLCNGLVGCRGVAEVALFDVEAGSRVSCVRGFDDELQSVCWSYSGHLMVATSKDKKVHVMDVRGSAVTASSDAHGSHRTSKCIWLGDSHNFLSCGNTTSHDREVAIWDVRQMEEPVQRLRVDSSPGPLMPFFDQDLGLLTLLGKGNKSFRLYEYDGSSGGGNFLHPIGNMPLMIENTKGAAFLPKQNLDLMGCEVNRLLSISETMIQPVSFTVPRREKLKFHADLFPDTISGAPASLTSAEWLGGQDGTPARLPLTPPLSASSAHVLDRKASQEGADEAGEQDDDTDSAHSSRRLSTTSSKRSSYGSMLKFRHLYGNEGSKDESYFNLTPALGASETALLVCNDQYWACPWTGGGGPVYVSPHSQTGKVQPTCHLIKGHKGPVLDMAFSPFHEDLLVTGSDDTKAKLWRIPEGGLDREQGEDDALGVLSGHRNVVKACVFHPSVSGALATASSDSTVRLWDIDSSQEIFTAELGLPDGGSISNISFNYTGSQIVAACKDKMIRFVDFRTSTVVGSSPPDALGRNLRTVWAANSSADVVLTTSTVSGNRQLSSWDPRNMSAPMITLKLDSQSGTLYPFYDEDTGMCIVGGKGDSTFRVFELSLPGAAEDGKYSCAKSTEIVTSGEPIAGMCLLPKTRCNVRDVEVNRVLKLSTNQVTPISLVLPRADNLKEFFQDDLFPPTRSRTTPAASVAEWVQDPAVAAAPVFESLQPPGMELLSARTVQEVKVTKAQQFRDTLNKAEDENKKREETFQRLQELAIQRSKFHPNASGGAGGHGFKVDATPVHDEGEDSDGGWSD